MKTFKLAICSLLLTLLTASLFAQPQYSYNRNNPNYVADDSSSTEVYVSKKDAEKFRRLRFKFFIPGLFIGRLGATLDFSVTRALSIGGIYRSWTDGNTQTDNQQGDKYNNYYTSYGLNVEYAVNGNLNATGWVINPRAQDVHYRFSDGFLETDADKRGKDQASTNLSLLFMYQWTWPTGIYLQLGFGPDYMSNPNNNLFSLSHSNYGGDWDFAMGYAF